MLSNAAMLEDADTYFHMNTPVAALEVMEERGRPIVISGDSIRVYSQLSLGPLVHSELLDMDLPTVITTQNRLFFWNEELGCYLSDDGTKTLYMETEEITPKTKYEIHNV